MAHDCTAPPDAKQRPLGHGDSVALSRKDKPRSTREATQILDESFPTCCERPSKITIFSAATLSWSVRPDFQSVQEGRRIQAFDHRIVLDSPGWNYICEVTMPRKRVVKVLWKLWYSRDNSTSRVYLQAIVGFTWTSLILMYLCHVLFLWEPS